MDDETSTAFGLLVSQLSKLQDSVTTGFRDLASEIAKLRDETVARREFDRFRDELRLEWAEAEQHHDSDIQRLQDDHIKASDRAERNRRWLVGTTIAAFSALAGAIAAVADLVSHLGH